MTDILWSNDDVIFKDGDVTWKSHETDLQALSESSSNVDGSLDSQPKCTSSAKGISSVSGWLISYFDGRNSILSNSSANGFLEIQEKCSGCTHGVGGASGFLNVETELGSSAIEISGVTGLLGSLEVTTPLAGSAVGIVDIGGWLGFWIFVAGDISTGISGASGELDIQPGCIGSAAGISGAEGVPFVFENYVLDEQSIQDGQPVELYLFNRDNGAEYWSYTSTDYNIIYDGRTYIAALIRRGDIALDLNSLKTQLEIEVDLSNLFARSSINEPIEGVVQLIVYRRHLDSYVTYWKGYFRGIKFGAKTAKIIVGLKNSSLKRFGLMRKFQRKCGLALYSTWCRISDTDSNYYVDGTINSVSGTLIDATILSTKTDDWFLGGKFKTDNGSCLQKIVYHSETQIKIARPVSALKAGDTFRAWAGCNHLKATCKTKFSNKLNYGGQPYLPDKNPFTGDAIA